uniref:7TM GPCR serpentine receptor class x (Srx) domain-containing protein n=1 Tax=Acrobeloides nanus TaxID=290746 RepID=A0A914DD95_9BILA
MNWFDFHPEGNMAYFIMFGQTWAGLLLNTIHAIVVFTYTSLAKEKLREIFGKKNSSNIVSAIAHSNQHRTARIRSEPAVVPMRNL